MKETLKSFACDTTIHGLRYVVATSGTRRLMWILCLLTSFGYFAYNAYDRIDNYRRLPTNTVISSETPDGLEFPDITICNLNPIAKSKTDIGYDDPLLKKLKLNLPVCDVIRNISGNLTCGQALMCVNKPTAIYFIRHCDVAMQDKLRQVLNTSSRIFNMEEFLYRYGHDLHEMLMPNCAFGLVYRPENICTADDFDPVLSPMGLCYTFNVTKFNNRTGGKESKIQFPGPDNGLNLVLNVHSEDTLFGEWSSGARVTASQRGETANPFRGFNVAPGSHSRVDLTAIKIERLPAPFASNCSERHLPGFPIYSKDACLYNCLIKKSIESCGCRPTAAPGYPEVPVCSIGDNECYLSALDNLQAKNCSCNLPCKEILYEPRISMALFPNVIVEQMLRMHGKINVNRSKYYIRDNFLYLQVGLREIEYKINKLQQAYETSSLLGEIGGNMGLLLGCSVITLVEFVDIFYTIICQRISSKLKNKIDKRTMDDETADRPNHNPSNLESKNVNNQWVVT